MSTHSPTDARRAHLLQQLFPGGIPTLWCPLLTHYGENGALDAPRMAAHLRHLSAHVTAFLIPGSTGDGWQLGDARTRQLLELALEQAQQLHLHLLIGVLKADAAGVLAALTDWVGWLKRRTGENDLRAALVKARVRGFTVCPPRGEGESGISAALVAILETGLPIALYQLPQVTQNEISPDLASDLAARFENFIFFKDSSGADRVVLSGKPLGGVFAVRGAEGDYARWLEKAGGPYQGFLLSTANCFARELRQIIEHVSQHRLEPARELSHRVATVIEQGFGLTRALPVGNPFANANKAIDHFFAYGHGAAKVPPPRLYSGDRLPVELILATEQLLDSQELLPATGYLDLNKS
jgi:dihydrodipicolinate synthase/N-acetylneuraminate lyase